MDKIAVLDFGGQYAHLIANRVRRLNVYSEILDSDTPAEKLKEYKGIIMSGGPNSVYADGAPTCDPELFYLGIPVLGICYGLQLMVYKIGGKVDQGEVKEYGTASVKFAKKEGIFKDMQDSETVWMSHGDEVKELPEGMEIVGSSDDCANAAVADFEKNIYGVQFHPEVTHTPNGMKILENFIDITGAAREWDLSKFITDEMGRIKTQVGENKVFMLISGGVDSTVAYKLIQNAIGPEHTHGLFVDTGLMRQHEREEVEEAYKKAGIENVHFFYAGDRFFDRLVESYEPEAKRKIIGDTFIDVQKHAVETMNLNPEEWLLGQGTIYPDTIETGGTKHSDKIKTHHNRVEQIQKLVDEGKVVEPLTQLYKDEVREVGRKLGIDDDIVNRHPFPGPGLGVRCLCAKQDDYPENHEAEETKINEYIKEKYDVSGQILPLKSVGVQGDARTYRHPFLLKLHKGGERNWDKLGEISTDITNRFNTVNRVLLMLHPRGVVDKKVKPGYMTKDRVEILQKADYRVTQFIKYHKMYEEIWQFPVVLLPISLNNENGECIVLRPIQSEEAMTANFYHMKWEWVDELTDSFIDMPEINGVFYDLTNKPPGTIEWE